MAVFYSLLSFSVQVKHQWAAFQARVRKQKIQQHVFHALNKALGSPLTGAASGERCHAVQPALPPALAVLQLPFLCLKVSPALLSNSEKEKPEISPGIWCREEGVTFSHQCFTHQTPWSRCQTLEEFGDVHTEQIHFCGIKRKRIWVPHTLYLCYIQHF